MIYFILFFILWLLFIYITKDRNFYKLIMIWGKKGSGKTSFIAKESLYFVNKGYRVYTNCNIPGTFNYNPRDIGINTFPPESIVFCDEVGLIWHNRDFKNFSKCVIEWFKYQRQYKIRMYLFSQAFDCDKVLRDLTDEMFIVRRLGYFSILRPVIKKIGISKDNDGNGQLVDTYSYGSILNCQITFLPRYYSFFKSFNPPSLPEINSYYQEYNEFQKLCISTKNWLLFHLREKAKQISFSIKSKFNH